jgi:hypothetical protein
MANAITITGWITLFFGLYAIAAGVGEWRRPGFWERMLWEMQRSHALQFMVGFFCLILGAAVYLVNPWRPADWLAILISVLGGWIAVQGLALLAFGERFLGIAGGLMRGNNRIWAALSVLIGLAMAVIGYLRVHV